MLRDREVLLPAALGHAAQSSLQVQNFLFVMFFNFPGGHDIIYHYLSFLR